MLSSKKRTAVLALILLFLATIFAVSLSKTPGGVGCLFRNDGRCSPWFLEKYEPAIPLFWTARTRKISDEKILDWWSLKQGDWGWQDAERYYGRKAGRDELMDAMVAPYPELVSFYLPRNKKSPTCAVVGSARNLLGAGYGPLIDAHDIVIRVNKAITKDFEKDLGTKITHHLLWHRSSGWNTAKTDSQLLVSHHWPADLVSLANDFKRPDYLDRFSEMRRSGRIAPLHPSFEWYCKWKWLNGKTETWASSGIYALILALHQCESVDVYGFGASSQGCWDRYFDTQCTVPTIHDAPAEAALIKKLEEEKLITVFPGVKT